MSHERYGDLNQINLQKDSWKRQKLLDVIDDLSAAIYDYREKIEKLEINFDKHDEYISRLLVKNGWTPPSDEDWGKEAFDIGAYIDEN